MITLPRDACHAECHVTGCDADECCADAVDLASRCLSRDGRADSRTDRERKTFIQKLARLSSVGFSLDMKSSNSKDGKFRLVQYSELNIRGAYIFSNSPIRRKRLILHSHGSKNGPTLNLTGGRNSLHDCSTVVHDLKPSKSLKNIILLDKSMGDVMKYKWKSNKPRVKRERITYLSNELINPRKVEAHLNIPVLPDSSSPDRKGLNIFQPNIRTQHYEPVSQDTAIWLGMIAGSRNYIARPSKLKQDQIVVKSSYSVNQGSRSISVNKISELKSLLQVPSQMKQIHLEVSQAKQASCNVRHQISVDSGSVSRKRPTTAMSPILLKEKISLNTRNIKPDRQKSKFFINNLIMLSEMTKKARLPHEI